MKITLKKPVKKAPIIVEEYNGEDDYTAIIPVKATAKKALPEPVVVLQPCCKMSDLDNDQPYAIYACRDHLKNRFLPFVLTGREIKQQGYLLILDYGASCFWRIHSASRTPKGYRLLELPEFRGIKETCVAIEEWEGEYGRPKKKLKLGRIVEKPILPDLTKLAMIPFRKKNGAIGLKPNSAYRGPIRIGKKGPKKSTEHDLILAKIACIEESQRRINALKKSVKPKIKLKFYAKK